MNFDSGRLQRVGECKARSTDTAYPVPKGGRVIFPCRVTSGKVSELVREISVQYTHQQINEDHVLRTTLSRVTKDLSSDSFPSWTQIFVFGSSAGASLTSPESIVKMSVTSYSSILSESNAQENFRVLR